MKIIWRVQSAPVGRYRSFDKRGWPQAFDDNEDLTRESELEGNR